ncbi:MAG: hypothetical protein GY953_01495, partial [bacterium]|nr:hypothetical protein [bacterium]
TIRVWEAGSGESLRTLEGHGSIVWSVAWSPDGKRLASGAADSTIRVWEAGSGRHILTLEGHTEAINCLAWSTDGGLLASATERGEVRLWKMPEGEHLETIPPIEYRYANAGLAFLPVDTLDPVFSNESLHTRAWSRVEAAVTTPQVRFASAKVVLVGESSIGKSGLALRLAENRFEDTATTHGMKIWRMPPEKLDPAAASPPGERRELFLWDMGGQEEYRLVHQLFLHDTTLALFLFHPTRGEKAFKEVEDWNRRLDKQLGERKATKLLVRSKIDIEKGPVDRARRDRLSSDGGFVSYHEVSAKEDRGIDEFRAALSAAIDWDEIGKVSRPALFQRIRDRIETLRQSGKVFLFFKELQDWAQLEGTAELETVVNQLAQQGLLVDLRLASGERVLLLQVEQVERYAGSIIIAARDNPRGVPAVEQQGVFSRKMKFPGIKKKDRLKPQDELVVVQCVTQLLIDRNLCLDHEGLLVFPHLFKYRGPAVKGELEYSRPIYYDFTGAIDNIYSSLAVKLALGERFGAVRLYEDRAEYQQPKQGLFGLRKIGGEHGRAHLDL